MSVQLSAALGRGPGRLVMKDRGPNHCCCTYTTGSSAARKRKAENSNRAMRICATGRLGTTHTHAVQCLLKSVRAHAEVLIHLSAVGIAWNRQDLNFRERKVSSCRSRGRRGFSSVCSSLPLVAAAHTLALSLIHGSSAHQLRLTSAARRRNKKV